MTQTVRQVVRALSLLTALTGTLVLAQTTATPPPAPTPADTTTAAPSVAPGISLRILLTLARSGPEVQAARLRLEAATRGAQVAAVPLTGTLSGGYALSNNPNTSGPGGTIGLNFNLGRDAQTAALKAVADARRAVRDAEFRTSRAALERWHSLRQARAALITAQLALTLAEQQDGLSAFRLEGGEINALERDRTALARQQAQTAVQRLQLQLDGLSAQIRLTWNVAVDQLSLTYTPFALPTAAPGTLDARPDVTALNTTLNDTQTQLDRARRETRPTFAVDGTWTGTAGTLGGALKSDLTGSLGYSSPVANPIYGYTLRLSANLSINPTSWTQLGPLESGVALAQDALSLARRGAQLDVDTKRQSAVLAQSALALSSREEQLAQTQLQGTQQRAASGGVGPLELRRAQIDARKTTEAVLTAQAEADRAMLDLYDALALPFPEMP